MHSYKDDTVAGADLQTVGLSSVIMASVSGGFFIVPHLGQVFRKMVNSNQVLELC